MRDQEQPLSRARPLVHSRCSLFMWRPPLIRLAGILAQAGPDVKPGRPDQAESTRQGPADSDHRLAQDDTPAKRHVAAAGGDIHGASVVQFRCTRLLPP